MSGFIKVNSGSVFLDGEDILKGDEKTLAQIRQPKLGFIFQDFMLLNGLKIKEKHTNKIESK